MLKIHLKKKNPKNSSGQTYVHLWRTAPQQVDKSRVEGHDGIAHVHHLLLIVTISRPESREGAELVQVNGSERRNQPLALKLEMSPVHIRADTVHRARQVQSRSLRDLNGFLHGGQ